MDTAAPMDIGGALNAALAAGGVTGPNNTPFVPLLPAPGRPVFPRRGGSRGATRGLARGLEPLDGELVASEESDEEAEADVHRRQRVTYYAPFMVHRKLGVDGKWIRCNGDDDGHQLDSRVHRYDREIGFLLGGDAQEVIERNPAAADAYARRREDPLKRKSHNDTVEKFSVFERYVLARMPNEPYAKWLRRCEALEEGLCFLAPPEPLVVVFMDALRDDPHGVFENACGGTIKVYLAAIGSVCREFGAEPPTSADAIAKTLKRWRDEDGEKQSASFDMEKDMKTMFGLNFCSRRPMLESIETWSMFLIAICLFARASEMTKYCPLFEDILLPANPSQWDADGFPMWIELALTTWKSRTKKHQGKRYGMRVYRNYLDSRFCPVMWLLIYLHYAKITQGPLFQPRDAAGVPTGKAYSEQQWSTRTRNLFTAAGLYTPGRRGADGTYIPASGVTNHGIRRSAAQWAGRCGAKELEVANNGRWKTTKELSKYMAQGACIRAQLEHDTSADPIFKTWVWRCVTFGSASTGQEL